MQHDADYKIHHKQCRQQITEVEDNAERAR